VGRINVSLDARYPVVQELVIKADLAASEPSLTVVSAAMGAPEKRLPLEVSRKHPF
jgi:hypothetical protein